MRGSLFAVLLGSVWVCLVLASSTNNSKCSRHQLACMFTKAQSKLSSTQYAEDEAFKDSRRHLFYLYHKLELGRPLAVLKNIPRITMLSGEKQWMEKPKRNAHSSSVLPVDENDVPGQTQLKSYPPVGGQQNIKPTFRHHTVIETIRTSNSVELEQDPYTIPERTRRQTRDVVWAGKVQGWSKHLTNGGLNVSADTVAAVWEAVPRPLPLNVSADHLNMYPTKRPGLQTLSYSSKAEVTPGFRSANSSRRRPLKNPFYPLTEDSYGAYAIICLAVVIFFVGILGNVSIMCIVCHNYYMRSISNSLLANLAFWDFLIIFFCLPLVIFHEITKTWLLGDISCKIIPYIEVASLGVTTFTLCALCIDRFRAATNVQMYYEMIENCTSTAAKLAVIWVGALLLALPEVILRQLIKEDPIPGSGFLTEQCIVKISPELPDTIYVLALTYDGARLWWYFGCYFCLPTLFTIGCSLVTARKIRQAEKACARGNKRQIHLESQMNCTVVALTILYGFCIIPENICNIVAVYMATGVSKQTMALLHLISQFLLFFKSCVTPVLLFCLCKPFSQAFIECCCCCCEECMQRSSTATSDENDNEFTTELELSPFSTIHREMSAFSSAGTHC